jgi:hypothetical protein
MQQTLLFVSHSSLVTLI